MKKFSLFPIAAAFALAVSCEKPLTEAEKNAQIEREVQQRLAAERQADDQQKLAQQQADLAAREQALADKEAAARRRRRCRSHTTRAPPDRSCNRMIAPFPPQILAARVPTTPFIANWSLMAPGERPTITASSGNRGKRNRATGVPTPKAAGLIPTLAGPGFRANRMAGRLVTMDAGRACAVSAGFGCPVKNGRRRGFHGARAINMSAGLLFRRKRASSERPASRNGPTAITISMSTNTSSSRTKKSARRTSSARSFRWSETSPS